MSGQIPWGVPLLSVVCVGIMLFRGRGSSTPGQTVNSLIILPIMIIALGGIFYNFTYPDFCIVNMTDVCSNPAAWVNGFPTAYTGCVSDCVITLFSLLGSTPFSAFLLAGANGDYLGLFASMFLSNAQTPVSIIAFIAGSIFIFLGSGIGVNILAGSGFTINEAGTRFFQSFGTTSTILLSSTLPLAAGC